WYVWTPWTTACYTISTCAGSTATNPGDGVLAIYTSSGRCGGPFVQVGCDDDGCGDLAPSIVGPQIFTAGTPYYILASHYPIANGGGAPITQYQIRIEGASLPPPNDLCQGAEVIPSGGPFPYSTTLTPDLTGATTVG